MDNYLQEVLKKIETHREKHPELMNMWTYYFNIKKKIFLESLKKCDKMLQEIDDLPQFDEKNILLIYVLMKYNIINI